MPQQCRTILQKRARLVVRSWLTTLGFATLGLVVVGCGEIDRTSQFIPTSSVAESAIRQGMEAWKRDEPAGPVAGTTKPVVQMIDSHRKPGQKLKSYEILGEVPGNAPRCFAVKTELGSPDKQEKLRYIVVGIDPLWVFLQEDYDMLSHWEHIMDEEIDKKSKEKSAK